MPRSITLRTRSNAITLDTRSRAMTLRTRSTALSVDSVAWVYDAITGSLAATLAANTLSSTGTITSYFYDTFTGANGTLLTSHTPDIDIVGGGWVKRTGATMAQINNNRVEETATTSTVAAYCNVGIANFVASMNVELVAVGISASVSVFIARYVDENNYWLGNVNFNTSAVSMIERTSGGNTTRATGTAAAFTTGVIYPASFTVSGNNLTFTINGATLTYTSASHNTATRAGFILSKSASRNPTYDNFEVRAV